MRKILGLCPRIGESEMRPASEEEVECWKEKKFEQRKLKLHQRKGIIE